MFQSIDNRGQGFDGTMTTSCLDQYNKINKPYFSSIESTSLKYGRPDNRGKNTASNGISLKDLLKKPDFGVSGYSFNPELRFNF